MKSLVILISFSSLSLFANAQANNDLVFSICSDTLQKRSSAEIHLVFKNPRKEKIRILNLFDLQEFPVFVSLYLMREKSEPIDLPGGGKISFGVNQVLTYIDIFKGDEYHKVVNLNDLMNHYGQQLKAGRYLIKADYHNQYGENCVKGYFSGPEVKLKLID